MIEKRWVIKDSDGAVLNEFEGEMDTAWIGREFNETIVASVEQLSDIILEDQSTEKDPRDERAEVFACTLDKLNWFWAASFTPEQQAEIAEWRQAWLDYPETGIKPDMLPYLPY